MGWCKKLSSKKQSNENEKRDQCFFYHSVNEKSIVGIVEVHKEHYPDPTDKSKKFVAIDVKAVKKLKFPVTLDRIKKNKN